LQIKTATVCVWRHLLSDCNWLFYYMKEDPMDPIPKPPCIFTCINQMDIVLNDTVEFMSRELGSATIVLWIKEAFEPSISSEDDVPRALKKIFSHDPYLIVQLLVAAIRTFEERTFQLASFVLEPPAQGFVIPGISEAIKCIWEHVFKHYLYYYLRIKGLPMTQPKRVSEILSADLNNKAMCFIYSVYAHKALFTLIKDSFVPPLTDDIKDLKPKLIDLMDANPMFVVHILVTCTMVYQRFVEEEPETCPVLVADVVDDVASPCFPPPTPISNPSPLRLSEPCHVPVPLSRSLSGIHPQDEDCEAPSQILPSLP